MSRSAYWAARKNSLAHSLAQQGYCRWYVLGKMSLVRVYLSVYEQGICRCNRPYLSRYNYIIYHVPQTREGPFFSSSNLGVSSTSFPKDSLPGSPIQSINHALQGHSVSLNSMRAGDRNWVIHDDVANFCVRNQTDASRLHPKFGWAYRHLPPHNFLSYSIGNQVNIF